MKFGTVALGDARDAVLAHSIRLPDGTLRKGVQLGEAELARLRAAGLAEVLVARLEAEDVPEDQAAAQMAAALAGAGVEAGAATTGRVNLYAAQGGLLRLDVERIHAANRVHESVTIATLLSDTVVEEGQMLATVKVIPYAAPGGALAAACAAVQGAIPAVRIGAWTGMRVALVLTRLPATADTVLAKMRGAVSGRLGPLGGQIVSESVVPHDTQALQACLRLLCNSDAAPELVLISGIAATVDRGDVVPAAILAAGGAVLHAGMPVDPGNLLVLGELAGGGKIIPVVGIPTCARSPKLNGFDFVLRRYAAGEPVTRDDIVAMGVGGLLTEIETRPMPRDAASQKSPG